MERKLTRLAFGVISIFGLLLAARLVFGQEVEATRTLHWSQVAETGLKAHFNAMMVDLKAVGCLAARGEAHTSENNHQEVVLKLKCTLFEGTNAMPEIRK